MSVSRERLIDSASPGSRHPLLPGVRSRMVRTPRLTQHIYESGPADGEPLLLIHGNMVSGRFFEELMAALPMYHIIAPDLRGYGATEPLSTNALRGVRDYSDDIAALARRLRLRRFHLLGWSLGGVIAMQYLLDYPQHVQTLTLHATGSPFGFGGTADADGTPNHADCAGSGGGLVYRQVAERYNAGDTTARSPFTARYSLRNVVVRPSFRFSDEREDILVEQMLMMRIGEQHYPGDSVPSSNWPYVAPGVYGPNNALSPRYLNLAPLGALRDGPPMLWIRGADDMMVSDASQFDPAMLGRYALIRGWPGRRIFPPQPMLTQIRALLDRYASNGGSYREVVLRNCGHAPMIEQPEQFQQHLRALLDERPIRPL
jgi:pimeloyl-ACP methyl ester carboxylesterase